MMIAPAAVRCGKPAGFSKGLWESRQRFPWPRRLSAAGVSAPEIRPRSVSKSLTRSVPPLNPALAKQACNPSDHPMGQSVQVSQGRGRQFEERRLLACVQHGYAVQDQGMDMLIQAEGAAEPLHRKHRTG